MPTIIVSGLYVMLDVTPSWWPRYRLFGSAREVLAALSDCPVPLRGWTSRIDFGVCAVKLYCVAPKGITPDSIGSQRDEIMRALEALHPEAPETT